MFNRLELWFMRDGQAIFEKFVYLVMFGLVISLFK